MAIQNMKGALAALVALTMSGWFGVQEVMSNPMENWAWKNRPLIIVAPHADDAKLAEQRRALAVVRSDLQDRDMTVVEIVDGRARTVMGSGPQIDAAGLMSSLNLNGDRFTVVLIGKDTGVKLRSDRPVTAQALFSLIDSMPMRQREMRSGS